MLAPRKALMGNLNYVHLQHVSLGVHLSLMEGPFARHPSTEDVTGCHHFKEEKSPVTVQVDANSNDPSIPCQCCDEHPRQKNICHYSPHNNLEQVTSDEDLMSPCDPLLSPLSASSNSSSSSDFTLDDSPISMYYKEFSQDAVESPDQQPEIIPLDSVCGNLISSPQGSSACPSPQSASHPLTIHNVQPITKETSTILNTEPTAVLSSAWASDAIFDANCNTVLDSQSPPLGPASSGCLDHDKELDQRAEVVADASERVVSINEEAMAVLEGPSLTPFSIEELPNAFFTLEDEDCLLPGLPLPEHVSAQSPRKTITSFHELAQRRRKSGGGGQPVLQVKKDKSDWLIIFSPDTEHPPVNELTDSAFYHKVLGPHSQPIPAAKEITTFRELRYRNLLIKQGARQGKGHISGEDSLHPAVAEKNVWHSDMAEKEPENPAVPEKELENKAVGEKEPENPAVPGKEPQDSDVKGPQHTVTKERGFQQLVSRCEQREIAKKFPDGLWSVGGHPQAPVNATSERWRQRGGHLQPSLQNVLNNGVVGDASLVRMRGTADGGDKSGREACAIDCGTSAFCPWAHASPQFFRLPTNQKLLSAPAPPSLVLERSHYSVPALLPWYPCSSLPTLPARLSPVGAFSPPHRGLFPLLDTPNVSVLLSPLFPRSRNLPRLAPEREALSAPLQDIPDTVCDHNLLMDQRREASEKLNKKDLLFAVSASVDKIICHFNTSRNKVQKAQLGDSRLSPELGYLLLHGLCPSLYALLGDGLKPFQKDVISGRRRLSPWSLVESSVSPGLAQGSIHSLLYSVSRLSELRDPHRRFNAFIFGLLNTKQLDLWVSHLHQCSDLTSVFFLPTGFVLLAASSQPELLDELLLILQPLSALTFYVDLLFEHHHLTLHNTPPLPLKSDQPGADTWGRSSLQNLLNWGGRLAQGLASSTEKDRPGSGTTNTQNLFSEKAPTKDVSVDCGNTPQDPSFSCQDTPQNIPSCCRNTLVDPSFQRKTSEKSDNSWWGRLSQASRMYVVPKRDSFTLTQRDKLMDLGNRKTISDGTESEGPLQGQVSKGTRAETSCQDSQDSSEGSRIGDGASTHTGAEWHSLAQGKAKKYTDVQTGQNDPLKTQSTGEWGIWLGNLFGANLDPARQMESRNLKSRPPSSWLPPSMTVRDLIRNSSSSHNTKIPHPEAESQKTSSKPERSLRALCDYAAVDQTQLSFKKDDVLHVLGTVDEDWIHCRHGNDTGLVLVGYTSLIL
ncbi:AP-4 complex accessory subunit RUSC1 [Rhinophrynus dorsalis]